LWREKQLLALAFVSHDAEAKEYEAPANQKFSGNKKRTSLIFSPAEKSRLSGGFHYRRPKFQKWTMTILPSSRLDNWSHPEVMTP
jgi:hypothetical protein